PRQRLTLDSAAEHPWVVRIGSSIPQNLHAELTFDVCGDLDDLTQSPIYGSSVNGPVRYKCLSVIGKLMYFSLAGVLAWKDPHVLILALQIAEIFMEKLPGTFSKIFVREGVVHAADLYISEYSNRRFASIRPSTIYETMVKHPFVQAKNLLPQRRMDHAIHLHNLSIDTMYMAQ
ncbi:uncharacterized protein A4U43_C10F19130, partial [Asparagus officinalis]